MKYILGVLKYIKIHGVAYIEEGIEETFPNKRDDAYYLYNPFDVSLKEKSFTGRFLGITHIFFGKSGGNNNYKYVKFGVFDYLINGPVYLTTHLLRAITLSVFSATFGCFYLARKWCKKSQNNTLTRLLLGPFLFLLMSAFLAVSAVAFAVDKFVDYVGSAVRQVTNKLLKPLLGILVSPIILLLATITHVGYGFAGLVSKQDAYSPGILTCHIDHQKDGTTSYILMATVCPNDCKKKNGQTGAYPSGDNGFGRFWSKDSAKTHDQREACTPTGTGYRYSD